MAHRFAFQHLEVYQVSKAVAQLEIGNRSRWAELPGDVGSRLSRALMRLTAEIASGASESVRAEQRRRYQAARVAANEAMSCIEMVQLHGVLPSELRDALSSQLARVDHMLGGMVRRRSG